MLHGEKIEPSDKKAGLAPPSFLSRRRFTDPELFNKKDDTSSKKDPTKTEKKDKDKTALKKKKRDDAIKKLSDSIKNNSLEEAIAIVEGDSNLLCDINTITISDPLPGSLVFLVTFLNHIKDKKIENLSYLREFILNKLLTPSINNINLLAKDSHNNTVLHLAACGREYDICQAILKASIQKKIVQQLIYLRAKYRGTPLEDICAHFSPEQVQGLRALTHIQSDCLLNQYVPSSNGETELMIKIKRCSSPEEENEIVMLLEKVGVDVFFYESDYDGNTALHFAILYQKFEIAEKILECIEKFGQSHRVLSARNSRIQMPHQVLIELGIWLSLKKMNVIAVLRENEAEGKEEEKNENVQNDFIPPWVRLCENMKNSFGEYGILFAKPKQNLSSVGEIVNGYEKDFLEVDPIKRLFLLKRLYESYFLVYPFIQDQGFQSIHLLALGVLNQWTVDPSIYEGVLDRLDTAHSKMAGTVNFNVVDEFKKAAISIVEQLKNSKVIEDLNSAFSAADFVLKSLSGPPSEESERAYKAIANFFQGLKGDDETNAETKQKIIDYIMKNIVAEINKGNLRTRRQLQACEQGLKEGLIGNPYLSKTSQTAISTLFGILAMILGAGLAAGYVAVSLISVAVLVGSIGIGFGLFCVRKHSDSQYERKYHDALGHDYAVKEKLFKVFDGDWEGATQTINLT